MAQPIQLIPLLEKFIKESENGKRRKKNGNRLQPNTIKQYRLLLKHLVNYQSFSDQLLRIYEFNKLNKRERIREKNYWKRFYKKFSTYLYQNLGLFDNYVGSLFKTLKTLFNWVNHSQQINVGAFHNQFHIRKEEVEILVLSMERLMFLIHNKNFIKSLSPSLEHCRKIFVFGCFVGLRFDDLVHLKGKNIECVRGKFYLKSISKKTSTLTKVKLSDYCLELIDTNAKPRKRLFKELSLTSFNRNLKKLGLLAGWTEPVGKNRTQKGILKNQYLSQSRTEYRFRDLMSSHMMRRTAITTLLILGMPEQLVRSISGHSTNSSAFFRYVRFSQNYIDHEIDQAFGKLNRISNINHF